MYRLTCTDMTQVCSPLLNFNTLPIYGECFKKFSQQRDFTNISKRKFCILEFDDIECESKVKVTQSCLTLYDPMDCTFHGILQARILESVAVPFSGGSSQPRDQTKVSHIAGGFFTSWATSEAQYWVWPTSIHSTNICEHLLSARRGYKG